MNTLTRRQREFQEREQLFLDTARAIIRDQGFHALTMEKIAAETEYAKGTIYKHFANKEDLVMALCGQSLSYMVKLCEEMASFDGTPREKLAVVAVAYKTYSEKYPEELDLIMESRTGNLREKASQERIHITDENDARLLQLIREQIDAAIKLGHLKLPPLINKDDICFGLWALSFGVTVLKQASDLLINMNINDDDLMLSKQLTVMLDGYNWKPLSDEADYLQTLLSAQKHIDQIITTLK